MAASTFPKTDSVHQYVLAERRAFANSAEFRASVLKGFHAIRDREPSAMSADAMKVKVIVHEDLQWIEEK